MEAVAETKERYTALGITVVFHVALFALFVFIVFITPIPPFEIKEVPVIELEGMEGLGNADAGGAGQNDPDIATSTSSVSENKSDNSSANTIADESEPVVNVKNNPKNTNKDNKAEPPKEDAELLNALAALKKKDRNGGKGEGTGDGGSGTGNANGVGDGNSTGHGNDTPGTNGGKGWDLKGRELERKPDRMTDAEEDGIVKIEIIVNAEGKVIKAAYTPKGSTTTNARLISKAQQAAYQYKFNKSPDGKSEQYGTVTVYFTLE